jgi:signal transduction histidine kinase
MNLLRRVAPQTIAAQLTSLVIVAVLLGVGLASTVLFHFFYNVQGGINAEILPAVRAARIAAIVKMAEESRSQAELTRVLDTRSASVVVERVPMARLTSMPSSPAQDSDFVRSIKARLEETWGIIPLAIAPATDRNDSIVIKINDDSALVFEASPRFLLHNVVLIQTTCVLAIVTFITLFLSLYAVRRITAPLSTIASAARSFGHFPAKGGVLSEEGPFEIAQVAEALNDMRERVRSLVDERTHMIQAISHDLRTPLTRLRLRVERLSDASMRENMLQDIAIVGDMLGETLTFLREGYQSEAAQLVDVPSLLQTICAQFTDVGYQVSYLGPARFAFACRAQALTRAVANIVDNGTKHGTVVTVALHVQNESVRIDVSDDGPGIPLSLREKVFEPFFKVDGARRSSGRGGFGLGLPIARDIVRRHGGEIELLDHAPHGLTVRLSISKQHEMTTSNVSDIAGASSMPVERPV